MFLVAGCLVPPENEGRARGTIRAAVRNVARELFDPESVEGRQPTAAEVNAARTQYAIDHMSMEDD